MAKKKTKYEKIITSFWKCKNCDFEQAYVSKKCPVCSSKDFEQTR